VPRPYRWVFSTTAGRAPARPAPTTGCSYQHTAPSAQSDRGRHQRPHKRCRACSPVETSGASRAYLTLAEAHLIGIETNSPAPSHAVACRRTREGGRTTSSKGTIGAVGPLSLRSRREPGTHGLQATDTATRRAQTWWAFPVRGAGMPACPGQYLTATAESVKWTVLLLRTSLAISRSVCRGRDATG
jgi:hypothetical protein